MDDRLDQHGRPDGDGAADLAVTNAGSGTVSILINDGLGSLLVARSEPVGAGPTAIEAGDLNGDDRLDLAVADRGGGSNGIPVPGDIAVLLGNGDGTFVSLPRLTHPRVPRSLITTYLMPSRYGRPLTK